LPKKLCTRHKSKGPRCAELRAPVRTMTKIELTGGQEVHHWKPAGGNRKAEIAWNSRRGIQVLVTCNRSRLFAASPSARGGRPTGLPNLGRTPILRPPYGIAIGAAGNKPTGLSTHIRTLTLRKAGPQHRARRPSKTRSLTKRMAHKTADLVDTSLKSWHGRRRTPAAL